MKKTIEIIKSSRKKLISLTEGLSIEALNMIPQGFNNNIVWNIGHVIASQQILCYRNSNNTPIIETEFIDGYKNGTKPVTFVDSVELEWLKEHLFSTIDRLEEDIKRNIFENYNAYNSGMYPELRIETFRDVMHYLPQHEGLHLGYCFALKRILKG